MQTSILRVETLTSPPVTAQDTQVRVRSQLVHLRFPAVNGGLIWNRPASVVVRTTNGQEKIIPILDMTRIIIYTLAWLCFTGMFILMFLRRKKSES